MGFGKEREGRLPAVKCSEAQPHYRSMAMLFSGLLSNHELALILGLVGEGIEVQKVHCV